jgi:hypothetical protein
MNLKTCLLAFLVLLSVSAVAQDKIYKKNGDVVDGKVLNVGKATVIYKRADNMNGPEYTIVKKEVDKIVYENGTTDQFAGGRSERGRGRGKSYSNVNGGKKGKYQKKYGDNILTVIPGAYNAAIDGSMNDVGIGVCYERLLDEFGHIGFTLPLMMNFSTNRDFNNNYYYYGSYTPYSGTNNYKSVTFMPGVKFYPGRSNDMVRYSVGASFFAMFGSEPYQVYDYTTPGSGDWRYTLYGMMINNGVCVTVSKHFYMEFDLNGGIPFSDNRRRDHNSIDNLASPFIQFGLKLGGRF